MSPELKERFERACQAAVRAWPAEGQVLMLAEESSELAVAVHHWRRKRPLAGANLLAEMADVKIMIRQVELIVGATDEDLDDAMLVKIERLEKRLVDFATKVAMRARYMAHGYHATAIAVSAQDVLTQAEVMNAYNQGQRAREEGRPCGCPQCEPDRPFEGFDGFNEFNADGGDDD
jgi:hypothetical protein